MIAKQDVYIQSAYDRLEIISQDKQKRLEYEARQKALFDYNQFMHEATQRGIKEGIGIGIGRGIEIGTERGIGIGRQEGMVYAYYEMNMDTKEIALKVNLTEEEVLEIIKKKDNKETE